jgi:hypothetical protein
MEEARGADLALPTFLRDLSVESSPPASGSESSSPGSSSSLLLTCFFDFSLPFPFPSFIVPLPLLPSGFRTGLGLFRPADFSFRFPFPPCLFPSSGSVRRAEPRGKWKTERKIGGTKKAQASQRRVFLLGQEVSAERTLDPGNGYLVRISSSVCPGGLIVIGSHTRGCGGVLHLPRDSRKVSTGAVIQA